MIHKTHINLSIAHDMVIKYAPVCIGHGAINFKRVTTYPYGRDGSDNTVRFEIIYNRKMRKTGLLTCQIEKWISEFEAYYTSINKIATYLDALLTRSDSHNKVHHNRIFSEILVTITKDELELLKNPEQNITQEISDKIEYALTVETI